MTTLEEQALKRKEKINALKRKRLDRNGDDQLLKHEDTNILPTPKFRSYKPLDKTIGEVVSTPVETNNVDNQVKDLLALSKSQVTIDQLDIATLAPRRPDWDLKRDVAKKLEKLERRTQKAMAELIRDKLKEKQDLSDIAAQAAVEEFASCSKIV